METSTISLESYKFFELHLDPQDLLRKRNQPTKYWGEKDPIDGWGDGDHYIGVIELGSITVNGPKYKIWVQLAKLWKMASDDSKLKWHPVGAMQQGKVLEFECCERFGLPGKTRTRFKTENEKELLIFVAETDVHDSSLIQEFSKEPS